MNAIDKQREYYQQTAESYDSMFTFDPNDEHFIASAILSGLLDHYGIDTLLDVGCGTGRSLQYLGERHPSLSLTGVEPVEALRNIARQKSPDSTDLFQGDACNLEFDDNQFDCVTMFGVLHHIPTPEKAILEAIRVAKKIVFISDHNVYGMGSKTTKGVKQAFRDLGLRRLLKSVLTKGKGYHDTTWDGIFYPFSLVDYADTLSNGMSNFYTFSTKTPAVNLYRDASHIAMLSVKPGTIKI